MRWRKQQPAPGAEAAKKLQVDKTCHADPSSDSQETGEDATRGSSSSQPAGRNNGAGAVTSQTNVSRPSQGKGFKFLESLRRTPEQRCKLMGTCRAGLEVFEAQMLPHLAAAAAGARFDLPVWCLRWSQSSVNSRMVFGRGELKDSSIYDLLHDLISERISPLDLSPLHVVYVDGKLHSLDNRRLLAYKWLQAMREHDVVLVPCKIYKRTDTEVADWYTNGMTTSKELGDGQGLTVARDRQEAWHLGRPLFRSSLERGLSEGAGQVPVSTCLSATTQALVAQPWSSSSSSSSRGLAPAPGQLRTLSSVSEEPRQQFVGNSDANSAASGRVVEQNDVDTKEAAALVKLLDPQLQSARTALFNLCRRKDSTGQSSSRGTLSWDMKRDGASFQATVQCLGGQSHQGKACASKSDAKDEAARVALLANRDQVLQLDGRAVNRPQHEGRHRSALPGDDSHRAEAVASSATSSDDTSTGRKLTPLQEKVVQRLIVAMDGNNGNRGNAKTALNNFCQAQVGGSLKKASAPVYVVRELDGPAYQCTLTLACLGGQELQGWTCPGQRDAEEAAARMALFVNRSKIEKLKGLKPSVQEPAPATPCDQRQRPEMVKTTAASSSGELGKTAATTEGSPSSASDGWVQASATQEEKREADHKLQRSAQPVNQDADGQAIASLAKTMDPTTGNIKTALNLLCQAYAGGKLLRGDAVVYQVHHVGTQHRATVTLNCFGEKQTFMGNLSSTEKEAQYAAAGRALLANADKIKRIKKDAWQPTATSTMPSVGGSATSSVLPESQDEVVARLIEAMDGRTGNAKTALNNFCQAQLDRVLTKDETPTYNTKQDGSVYQSTVILGCIGRQQHRGQPCPTQKEAQMTAASQALFANRSTIEQLKGLRPYSGIASSPPSCGTHSKGDNNGQVAKSSEDAAEGSHPSSSSAEWVRVQPSKEANAKASEVPILENQVEPGVSSEEAVKNVQAYSFRAGNMKTALSNFCSRYKKVLEPGDIVYEVSEVDGGYQARVTLLCAGNETYQYFGKACATCRDAEYSAAYQALLANEQSLLAMKRTEERESEFVNSTVGQEQEDAQSIDDDLLHREDSEDEDEELYEETVEYEEKPKLLEELSSNKPIHIIRDLKGALVEGIFKCISGSDFKGRRCRGELIVESGPQSLLNCRVQIVGRINRNRAWHCDRVWARILRAQVGSGDAGQERTTSRWTTDMPARSSLFAKIVLAEEQLVPRQLDVVCLRSRIVRSPKSVTFRAINGKFPLLQVPWNLAMRPLPSLFDLHVVHIIHWRVGSLPQGRYMERLNLKTTSPEESLLYAVNKSLNYCDWSPNDDDLDGLVRREQRACAARRSKHTIDNAVLALAHTGRPSTVAISISADRSRLEVHVADVNEHLDELPPSLCERIEQMVAERAVGAHFYDFRGKLIDAEFPLLPRSLELHASFQPGVWRPAVTFSFPLDAQTWAVDVDKGEYYESMVKCTDMLSPQRFDRLLCDQQYGVFHSGSRVLDAAGQEGVCVASRGTLSASAWTVKLDSGATVVRQEGKLQLLDDARGGAVGQLVRDVVRIANKAQETCKARQSPSIFEHLELDFSPADADAAIVSEARRCLACCSYFVNRCGGRLLSNPSLWSSYLESSDGPVKVPMLTHAKPDASLEISLRRLLNTSGTPGQATAPTTVRDVLKRVQAILGQQGLSGAQRTCLQAAFLRQVRNLLPSSGYMLHDNAKHPLQNGSQGWVRESTFGLTAPLSRHMDLVGLRVLKWAKGWRPQHKALQLSQSDVARCAARTNMRQEAKGLATHIFRQISVMNHVQEHSLRVEDAIVGMVLPHSFDVLMPVDGGQVSVQVPVSAIRGPLQLVEYIASYPVLRMTNYEFVGAGSWATSKWDVEPWGRCRLTCVLSRNFAQPVEQHASMNGIILSEITFSAIERRRSKAVTLSVGHRQFPEMFSSWPDLQDWHLIGSDTMAYARTWANIRQCQMHAAASEGAEAWPLFPVSDLKWTTTVNKQERYSCRLELTEEQEQRLWLDNGDLAVLCGKAAGGVFVFLYGVLVASPKTVKATMSSGLSRMSSCPGFQSTPRSIRKKRLRDAASFMYNSHPSLMPTSAVMSRFNGWRLCFRRRRPLHLQRTSWVSSRQMLRHARQKQGRSHRMYMWSGRSARRSGKCRMVP
eukprot:TRINITY_DN2816_c0_g2_i1.p1 TRINITY_DN2816_c0_g2~~TRINITY_DN2816_c0_g2_i1.p1  ORF type:complete len:2156 (+),score=325.69 TRINITY_DN2816_c0_g2_i1:62-6529(+)